jgi:hypothetical protein
MEAAQTTLRLSRITLAKRKQKVLASAFCGWFLMFSLKVSQDFPRPAFDFFRFSEQ